MVLFSLKDKSRLFELFGKKKNKEQTNILKQNYRDLGPRL